MMNVSRREVWIGAILTLLVFAMLMEAKLWRPNTVFGFANNAQIGEAEAWLAGRVELPWRLWDTALKDGRVLSHFPPMFTIVALAPVAMFGSVPHWFLVLLVVLPIPLLAYRLFLMRVGDPRWAVVLTLGLIFGTSLYPVMNAGLRGAGPYMVNQMLAVSGLLIFLGEVFGSKRVGVEGAGIVLAALSRQLTMAYCLPLVFLAYWQTPSGSHRKRAVVLAVVGLLCVGVPLTLDTIKFGHPLDTGYMYLYNDRPPDQFSRDAQTHGLFSAHFVPRNLYYANVGLPRLQTIEVQGQPEHHLRPNRMGTGIWWTTPLLAWLFFDFRRILSDRRNVWLLIAAGVVFAALMFYHSTGYEQRGFNRYSLDYVPVLLAVVAPSCIRGRRRWISLAMVLWSVVYFRFLI